MKTINLLIVDDEPDIREIFAANFELEGHNIFMASNGKEGLEIVKNNKIDFIISDVRMPIADGVYLLDELKKNYPDTPVIVLVSGFAEISREEAIKRGALDLITKPPEIEELTQLILRHSKEKSDS